MLRELFQLGASADESGGVLELCCLVQLLAEGVVILLVQLFVFLLFFS